MARSEAEAWKIRPLAETELPDADALVHGAGWNQSLSDWRVFLELGAVRAIHSSNGQVIATAATLPYGREFGWISMVLVAREHQRLGLATRLLQNCIDELKADGLVPVLDATPAGRAVYRGLGFVDTWTFKRYARPDFLKASEGSTSRTRNRDISTHPITDAAWPDLCAYDAAVFGADRSELLARLRNRASHIARFAERHGRIAGMILGRDGRLAAHIGPLVAEDDEVALELLRHALGATRTPVFIDVPDTKSSVVARLEASGFTAQRPLTRMLLGRNEPFDDGRRTFAVAGPEFG